MNFFIFVLIFVTYVTASIRIDSYKDTLKNSSSRIINGQDANRGEYPYQVSIRHRDIAVGPRSHLCGGILIHPFWVLTAGHCRQRSGTYDVGLGLLDRDERRSDVQWIEVKKFIIHSKFSGGSKYDIGLLKLQSAALLTPTVKVINVPTTAEECDELTTRTLSGWGRTGNSILSGLSRRLQKAVLPIISEEECAEKLININGNRGPLDESMICTLYNTKMPQSACTGDDGGPLADLNSNTIIGIVIWMILPCGRNDAPTVYTNVCAYRDWIQETVAKNTN